MKPKRNILGRTGMEVSDLCLGVLPMGPLQANLPPDYCIWLINRAVDLGVNFLDTAEIYHTQNYIGEALKGRREQVVISTKSTKSDYDGMARSVERSLKELQTDYIDIYHLHAARLPEKVFTDRSGAIKCLTELKSQNVVRAIGIATHNCRAVAAAAEQNDIDVVFPLLNMKGIGLVDGTVDDMKRAILQAHRADKGVYLMKALGGGNLLNEFNQALTWAREVEGVDSVAVGIISEAELLINIDLFSGKIHEDYKPTANKRLMISKLLCSGCGSCLEACHNDALTIIDGKCTVDNDKCLLCGYCSRECEMVAIRLV
ncbi:MAG: aldo/keto reductase [Dethiobacter sp.]|nr:aldo/keto reductase [Dethiobacter sp.]